MTSLSDTRVNRKIPLNNILMFDSAWCLVLAQIKFSLIKKKDWTSRTLATPHLLTFDNIWFLPYTLKVDAMCASPLMWLAFFNKYPILIKSYKMVKNTQIIRRLFPTNCLSVFDHFVGLTLKGLKKTNKIKSPSSSLIQPTDLNSVTRREKDRLNKISKSFWKIYAY